MKRILSLILILAICLSMCACGNSTTGSSSETVTNKKKTIEVVGDWTATNETSRVYISLNEDYTGEMESEGIAFKFTWKYDKSTYDVTIDFEAVNMPGKLTYHPEDDTLIFLDGTVLSRVNG